MTYDAADPARALVTVLEDAMRAHPDAAREVLAQELGELERGEDEDAA